MRRFSYLGLVTGLLISNFSFAQNSCFTSLSDYSFASVSNGRCIEKADFNGDGNLDLAIGNYTTALTNQLGIILGDGDGTFGSVTSFTVGRRPLAIKAYDFNGDSFLDLAVANNFDHNISIIMGTGTGSFGSATNYSTGTSSAPNGMELGDFNEDGIMDIVVSTNNSGVSYLQGVSGGTFLTTINFTMGTAPRGITVNDFNVDGNLDIATANNSSANVSVRLGNGDGTFGAATNFAVQSGPFAIESANITTDGFIDLVVSNANSGTISLLVGDGTGNFAVTDNYSSGTGPNGLVVNDFNEDGILDVAVVNNTENTLSMILGTGTDAPTTVFTASPLKFPVMGTPQALIEGDFNGDFNLDLAVPGTVGGRLLVMLGDGNGYLNTGENIPTQTGPNGLVYGSFNGDANSDLVVANKTSNTITFLAGNGDGTYMAGVSFATDLGPVAVFAIDVNNDLINDIVTANSGSNTISVLIGDGLGNFAAAVNFPTSGTTPSGITCADFNGDMNIDVAVSHEGSNDVGVLIGNGMGSFGAATLYAVSTTPKGIISGQYNNTDTFVDLAVANFGSNNITVWRGDGTGAFVTSTNYNVSNGPVSLASADLTGDGREDIFVTCFTSSRLSYLRSSGASSFLAVINYVTGTNPQSVVTADFNNDGIVDAATANKVAAGSPGSVSVFMGSGSGTLGTKTDFSTGNNSISIVSGFINGGIFKDLAVVNFDANNVSILLNNTAVITAGGATTFCAGSSVMLSASAGTNYLWSNSATTASINATTSGNYYVVISNPSGLCSSQSNSITVTVNPLPTITSVTGTTSLCTSGSTSLTATASSGTVDVDWYDAPTGGTLVSSTNAFTTPVLASTTTYYIDGFDAATGCVMAVRYPVTISVGDFANPIISGMPSNMTLTAGAGCTAVATWTNPSATDECTLVSFDPDFANGSAFPLGITTVTYTATDGAAHTATASFTITVNDITDPVISGIPATINVNVAAGTCAQTVTWTDPTASDNCSVSSFSPDIANGSSFAVGTTTVTYTATDPTGNIATANFDVVVTDNIAPDIIGMPSDQLLYSPGGGCDVVATWTDPTASDNCAVLSFTGNFTSGATFPVGSTGVIFTAEDVNGNITTDTFTITVADTILPVISGTPANISVLTDPGVCTATVTWTDPTASDNCTVSSLTPSSANGSSFPVGITTVMYTATDANGNIAIDSFTVTVADTIAPSFLSFPSNISLVSAAGLCSNTATWLSPVGSDNCTVDTVIGSHVSGSSFNVGVTTVTYTVTDINGNSTMQSFTITVFDNQAPTLIGCPGTQTVCEGDTVNYTTPTATDNCSSATVTQMAGLPSGSVFPVGTTLCTFRAMDSTGNLINCNFNVIVNPKPVVSLSFTADTLVCDDDSSITLSGGSPSGGLYSGTGVASGEFAPATAGVGVYPITYTVTNGFGCSAEDVDSIEVEDCSGINENAQENAIIKLYPNPTNGIITVEIPEFNRELTLNVYSTTGNQICSRQLSASKTELNLIELANGVYFIRVEGEKSDQVTRLIIQR